MSKYIGRLVKLGVAREAVRGAGAAPVYHIPRTTLSFDDKVVKARSIGSLGNLGIQRKLLLPQSMDKEI